MEWWTEGIEECRNGVTAQKTAAKETKEWRNTENEECRNVGMQDW